MRILKRAAVAAVAAGTFASAAPAGQRDSDFPVYIYGQGMQSCGAWNMAGELERAANWAWAVGYVSGAGHAAAFRLRMTDSEGIAGWLDQYCRSHPLETLADAMKALIRELRTPK